jgi:hypothetical protein
VALAAGDDWHVVGRDRDRLQAILIVAQDAVRARAARISRLLSRRAAHDIAVERAIAATLADDRAALSTIQPGLFDRRTERMRLELDADLAQVSAQLDSRLAQYEARSVVQPGRPSILLVVPPGGGPARSGPCA